MPKKISFRSLIKDTEDSININDLSNDYSIKDLFDYSIASKLIYYTDKGYFIDFENKTKALIFKGTIYETIITYSIYTKYSLQNKKTRVALNETML